MRKTVLSIIAGIMALSLAVCAAAQEMGPPKVLTIIREEVKPGKSIAHNQHEAAWTQAFVKAKYATSYLGMASVTGNSEAWWLVGFDSFADMEKDTKSQYENAVLRTTNATFSAKDADFLEGSRTMTARYRPEFSYKPGVNIGEYKYFQITVTRFRLGENAEDFYKALNSAREKGGLDAHIAVYQVNSGMPAGTYIGFSPVKSMAAWDDPPNKAYQAALEEVKFSQLVGKMLVASESRLYSFVPQMSIVSEKTASADPDFWHPKPVMAKKAASGEVTPAAKKEAKK